MDDNKPRFTLGQIAFGFFELVFVIIALTLFVKILTPEPANLEMGINWSQSDISLLPTDVQNSIEFSIYDIVAYNTDNPNINKSGITVRNDSIVKAYREKTNVNYVTLIVDIPDLQQSYRVFYEWSDDKTNEYISPNNNAIAMCLNQKQIVYDSFQCKDMYPTYKETLVSTAINQYGYKIPGDSELSVWFNSNIVDENFKVILGYKSCGDMCTCKTVSEDQKQKAIATFENFLLTKLGLYPDDVSFSFDNCE